MYTQTRKQPCGAYDRSTQCWPLLMGTEKAKVHGITSRYTKVGLVQPKTVSTILLATCQLLAPPGDAEAIRAGTCSNCSCTTRTSPHTHTHTHTAFNMLVITYLLGRYRNYFTSPKGRGRRYCPRRHALTST